MLNKKILPVRDFKLAIIYATILMPLLWLAGHPVDEWAVTVAVLYVSLWLSREIVVYLVLLVLRSLSNYGTRVAEKIGVKVPAEQPTKHGFLSKFFLFAASWLVVYTIVGVSLSVGIPATGLVGITPLLPYFNWFAYGFLFVGGASLSFIFVITALAFATADTIHENSRARINRFYTITSNVASAVGK